ncbi:hypothetical protein SAMN05216428_101592 [Nitrosospira sp. Nsp11]|nr:MULTISPECIES: hypothetical protein [unclassified Nitrosospira]SDA26396.1 hypothetical protein SAMN05216315_1303 [Nitrosospira sp. Nsp18]SHL23834.1 hypothetical protein SAMN05216428_101592 [Nitrosospira sp. Nsp11]
MSFPNVQFEVWPLRLPCLPVDIKGKQIGLYHVLDQGYGVGD